MFAKNGFEYPANQKLFEQYSLELHSVFTESIPQINLSILQVIRRLIENQSNLNIIKNSTKAEIRFWDQFL